MNESGQRRDDLINFLFSHREKFSHNSSSSVSSLLLLMFDASKQSHPEQTELERFRNRTRAIKG